MSPTIHPTAPHADPPKINSVVLYEFMLRFVCPLCTLLPRSMAPTPVSAVTTIIDLSNTSFRQIWSLRTHLQEASVLANANYPETLGPTIVINAPPFFSTVWGWIKGWFDEGTRTKIHVFGKNYSSQLAEIIDPSQLPKKYGGVLDWEFMDVPLLDDEMRKYLDEMPRGPLLFDPEGKKAVRPKEYVQPEEPDVKSSMNGTAHVQEAINVEPSKA